MRSVALWNSLLWEGEVSYCKILNPWRTDLRPKPVLSSVSGLYGNEIENEALVEGWKAPDEGISGGNQSPEESLFIAPGSYG